MSPSLADTADKIDRLREAIAVEEDPDRLNALTLALRDELHDDWRANPGLMGNRLTLGELKLWPYVRLLSDQVVKAATGVSPRQIWNLPTRYGKTWMAKWGCVWVLDQTEGRAKLIICSYGYSLARETSVEVRDLLLMHGDVLHAELRDDRRRADRFVANNGGGLLAAGIDGSIIGFGAGGGLYVPSLDKIVRGGIFFDDPYKDWQEAHSEGRRNHIRNQFKSGLRSRLDEEEAFIIVIHQRMHSEDITDTLLEDTAAATGDAWEHVCLPEIAYEPGPKVAPDPLGRAPGEVLEPQRYTLEAALGRARGMGPYLAAAMQQQRPELEEGNELLRAWFVLADESELPRAPDRAVTSWDLKLKNREAGDFVVGQCWWAVGEARFCMDQLRGQYDYATTENAIALLAVRNPHASTHVVESAGSADEVVPELRRPIQGYVLPDEIADRLGMTAEEREKVQRLRRQGMGNIKMAPATEGSKQVRAREYIAPPAAVGNVRFPAHAPWVPALLDEYAAFPNGQHDDQVDASSQGLKELRGKNTKPGARRPTGTIQR